MFIGMKRCLSVLLVLLLFSCGASRIKLVNKRVHKDSKLVQVKDEAASEEYFFQDSLEVVADEVDHEIIDKEISLEDSNDESVVNNNDRKKPAFKRSLKVPYKSRNKSTFVRVLGYVFTVSFSLLAVIAGIVLTDYFDIGILMFAFGMVMLIILSLFLARKRNNERHYKTSGIALFVLALIVAVFAIGYAVRWQVGYLGLLIFAAVMVVIGLIFIRKARRM